MLRNISRIFLAAQTLGILSCWIIIIWAIIKSDGQDDTLGLFVTGFLSLSIYLFVFWIINLRLVQKAEIQGQRDYLKLTLIFILAIVPLAIVTGIIVQA